MQIIQIDFGKMMLYNTNSGEWLMDTFLGGGRSFRKRKDAPGEGSNGRKSIG
ncbi:MAG: hypothetical protein J5761_03650 [Paludibacteraceae bacterium]|nr:hypothetical protein [Paludibacteraceae bacterium]